MIFHLLLVLLVGTPVILEGQAPAPFGLLPTQVSPDSVRVEILKIGMTSTMDSVHATAGHPIETGWKATVQGTVSDREYQVFVLVHPLLGDSWMVQSFTSRPSKTGTWRTTCLFGMERKGKDEDYELIAVGSLERSKYRPGQRIPANQFPPTDMPQTDTILIRRIRSPNP